MARAALSRASAWAEERSDRDNAGKRLTMSQALFTWIAMSVLGWGVVALIAALLR